MKFQVIIWLTILKLSNGYLEEFQGYLTQSLSYLKKGLKIAQDVEEFIDNTIGEECIYECPKRGYEPVPRPHYKPSSNGCGSLDMIFDDSEESWIHVEKEFIECCNKHDYCYDTCGADKDECDLKFKKCLYGTCRKKQHQFIDSKKCRLKTKLFYLTVLGVGCQSYMTAQKAACQCVRTEL